MSMENFKAVSFEQGESEINIESAIELVESMNELIMKNSSDAEAMDLANMPRLEVFQAKQQLGEKIADLESAKEEFSQSEIDNSKVETTLIELKSILETFKSRLKESEE